jgi:hypothetical protein
MSHELTNLKQRDTGDGTILIMPWAYSGITQGTWVFGISSSQYYNGYFYNSSNAVNDQIDFKVWLSKGCYAVSLMVPYNTGMGSINLLLDSVHKSSIEPYADNGQVVGFPDLLYINTTGLKTLSLKVKTGGYAGNIGILLNAIRLTRVN